MSVIMDGRKLREVREAKGFTQEQLAERAGMSDRHIRNMESSAITPSAETLYNLSTALEVPMNELLSVSSGTKRRQLDRAAVSESERELSFRMPMPVTRKRYSNGICYPICPQCGNIMERDNMAFCGQCGQKLDWKKYSRAVSTE